MWWIAAVLMLAQATSPQKGIDLAMAGHCTEAMPELDAAMRDTAIPSADKRNVSMAGVRCSMLLNKQSDALSFLDWLQQKFPDDPDVLFLAVHVFSELSQRNADALMKAAPESPLVIQLNAETFEKRGEITKAIAEYKILASRVPDRQGVHYRIGGLLMPDSPQAAKKEFEEELRLNPQNASAEFYLGELSMQSNATDEAIAHYSRATTLYPGFAEAFAHLGRVLLDADRTSDAIAPLEKAVALAPGDPANHQALATAYKRSGRPADAAKEFALQKTTAAAINDNTKVLRKTVSGVQP